MRFRALFAAVILFAVVAPAAALVGPPIGCQGIGHPAELWAVPNQILTIPVVPGVCRFEKVTNPTPSVISIEQVTVGSPITVTVRTLAPGDGEVHYLATGGFDDVTYVHVEDCGTQSIKLLPSYGTALRGPTTITPEIHGVFNRGFRWTLNGKYIGNEPTAQFTPIGIGVFDLKLRAESECGVIDLHSNIITGPIRTRSVKH